MAPPLILASASPRRKALLEQIGLPIAGIKPANIDESPKRDEKPQALVARLATEKAFAIHTDGQFTLGADTLVVLGKRILDKTEDENKAREHLHLLSGRAHEVITSVCILAPDGAKAIKTVASRVVFKRLLTWEISAYIATHEWHGKAGGYAIQGFAGSFVKKITGSYSAIVGLPLCETRNALIGLGYRMHN